VFGYDGALFRSQTYRHGTFKLEIEGRWKIPALVERLKPISGEWNLSRCILAASLKEKFNMHQLLEP
jgi:hypothetical protein